MDNVSIITEPGRQWDHVFEEIAQAFADALADTTTQLVFGAHLLGARHSFNSKILYQSEQAAAFPDQLSLVYRNILLSAREVWDYSQANVEELKKYGIQAKFVPIRYMPSMARFQSLPPEQQDIDVLFYGSTNKRRIAILNDLIKAGLRVHKLYNVFGAERDAWIARSKVVLNMHNHEGGIFEIFRCAHLFANSKCVVSEMGTDVALENLYRDCAVFTKNTEQLVLACIELVENPTVRLEVERAAGEHFQTPTLRSELVKVSDNGTHFLTVESQVRSAERYL